MAHGSRGEKRAARRERGRDVALILLVTQLEEGLGFVEPPDADQDIREAVAHRADALLPVPRVPASAAAYASVNAS